MTRLPALNLNSSAEAYPSRSCGESKCFTWIRFALYYLWLKCKDLSIYIYRVVSVAQPKVIHMFKTRNTAPRRICHGTIKKFPEYIYDRTPSIFLEHHVYISEISLNSVEYFLFAWLTWVRALSKLCTRSVRTFSSSSRSEASEEIISFP